MKYRVSMMTHQVLYCTWEGEATSEADAEQKALEWFAEGKFDFEEGPIDTNPDVDEVQEVTWE